MGPFPYGVATASVSYRASAQPLEVILAGGIGPKHQKRYLMGQQVTATLNNGGLTPTYSWSASGGEPFKNWTASQGSATFTQLGTETGSQFVFNFKKPEPGATVTCTVHLSVPSGALPTAGFDEAVIRSCSSLRPDSASIGVLMGTVTPLPGGGPYSVVQLQRVSTYPPDGTAQGMRFDGQVTTPAAFVSAYDSFGTWNWTQLVTNNDQRKFGSTWEKRAQSLPPPASPPYRNIYGVQGLDNAYPYLGVWFAANGVGGWQSDSPTEPLEVDSFITAKDVLDSFDCWFMYLPPGPGSVAVPLRKINWFWEFHATKSSGLWSVSGTQAQWSLGLEYPAHPLWSFAVINDKLIYAVP